MLIDILGERLAMPSRDIDYVYIHCSATNDPAHDNIETIRHWHVHDRGWRDVGYQYFIRTDGTIEKGRPIDIMPAAQRRHNKDSIAICLHGLNVDDFTSNQFDSLRELCEDIDKAWEGDISFHGHCEVSNKTCPVFDYVSVLELDEEGFLL
tara:strand:- start:2950 stop:3402 length:453 start_codon:yes stop_codon:yes gene_type:complete